MKPTAFALGSHQAVVINVHDGIVTGQLLSTGVPGVHLPQEALLALRDAICEYLPVGDAEDVARLKHRVESLRDAMNQAATDLCMLDDRNGVAERVGQYLVDQAGDAE